MQLDEWFAQASRALRRGCLFAVDYGDLEPHVWLRQPNGSVESPGPEGLSPSPLADPGPKDTTAKVNFSAVMRAANARGFQPGPLVSQRDWLRSLGLTDVASELDLARTRPAQARLGGDEVALG